MVGVGSTVFTVVTILTPPFCRWLRASGITMGSERKMRTASKEMVGTNLASEAAPFSFSLKSGGEEIRLAPLVYVPDLEAKVFELLEQNERYKYTLYLLLHVLYMCMAYIDMED